MKYVISLGGSIIVPREINLKFIKKFTKLISRLAKKGHIFFIVTGGGSTARSYQVTARKLSKKVSDFDLDWMGISATKLNAQLLNSAFGKLARKGIINDPREAMKTLRKVNVVSGWKPGWSTDYVAVRIAQTYKVKTVMNFSNVDYVYEADPKLHKKAKKFKKLSWRQYLKKFGTAWDPGANVPFDPVGAKLAHKLGIKVIVMNGLNLRNFRNFLSQKSFRGTVIE